MKFSRSRKILLTFGILAVVVVCGAIWAYQTNVSRSFAPDRPEQARLARENVDCATLFRFLVAAADNGIKRFADKRKYFVSSFEFHMKMGYVFSPDKQKFEKQMENSRENLLKEMGIAAKQKNLDDFLAEREKDCIDSTFRSMNFVRTVNAERANWNWRAIISNLVGGN